MPREGLWKGFFILGTSIIPLLLIIEPPASRASTSNYLAGIHGNMRPTRLSSTPGRQIQDFRINHKRSLSPVRTAGLGSSMGPSNSSTQTSPALVNALFERVEQQAEVFGYIPGSWKILFYSDQQLTGLHVDSHALLGHHVCSHINLDSGSSVFTIPPSLFHWYRYSVMPV